MPDLQDKAHLNASTLRRGSFFAEATKEQRQKRGTTSTGKSLTNLRTPQPRDGATKKEGVQTLWERAHEGTGSMSGEREREREIERDTRDTRDTRERREKREGRERERREEKREKSKKSEKREKREEREEREREEREPCKS